MNFAVSSYSFHRSNQPGAPTQAECIQTAKRLGFDGIEFAEIHPHDGSSPLEYAKTLRREAQKAGLAITNLAVGADFLSGSGGDIQAEIERVKGMVDLAEALGAPCMRHDSTWGAGSRTFAQVLPQLADACRAVTEYAQSKGIRTMVENHGYFCQDSTRVEQLAAAVAHPNFGLLVDVGNFLCADESPVTAVGRIAPLAAYVHAKDFHVKPGTQPAPGRPFFQTRGGNWLRGAIIGHGDVPVRQCIAALVRAGYDGTVSIEFEGIEDANEAVAIGLENVRRFVEEAQKQ